MTVVVAEGLRLRSGRYELERRIGSGAAATVWLARDQLLERPVAVKILAEGLTEDRAWLARFEREARVAAQLQHPNLVSIYDFEAEAERPYLVMAYLSGGSLEDRLRNGGCPDPERLAVDVLRALAHIHEADIIHRDVKPGNVLLTRDGRACLTDFGVARPQDATAITQTGQIPGTARYMAPELWQGAPADERSDLFACGVLLAQCLRDDSSARLVSLVERLSAEERELRPASAVEALRVLQPEHPTPSQPPVLPPTSETKVAQFSRPPKRRWFAVAALCVAALIAGVLFANAIGGGEEPATPEPAAEREAGSGGGQESATADQSSPPPAAAETTTEPTADGAALNDDGFALLQQGRYDEAVPILEQAVDALEGSGGLDYAYALYNLGNALRLAGRPAEAIPILQQRLQIPNQTDVVEAELKRAEKDLKAQEKAKDG